jgi:hypothetical protein
MQFASPEWIAALVAALHRDPGLAAALAGLGHDAAFVVEGDGRAWPADVAAWARHERGRIAEWRILEDVDDILELEPAYVLRAPYRTWRTLFEGADPVKAALSGRIRVEGDLEALVRKSDHGRVVLAALSAVATEFP